MRNSSLEPRKCGRISLTAPVPARDQPDSLRHSARALAQRLLRLDPSVEHGALFYRTASGTIRTGDIAVGDANTVQLEVDTQPGELMVGALHTHARQAYHTGNQSKLSREDIELGEQLLVLPDTARPLRLYIVDVGYEVMTEYAVAGRC